MDMYLDSNSNVRLIKKDDGEYPVSIRTAVSRSKEYALGDKIPVSVLEQIGYAAVTPTVKPEVGENQYVVEVAPALQSGVYYEDYEVRTRTPEELDEILKSQKDEVLTSLKDLFDKGLRSGMPYDFGGQHGVQHIQLRDSDRINITGLKVRADDNPGGQFGFRTFENNFVPMPSNEIEQMAAAAFDGFTDLISAKWLLESQINAATKTDEIPVLPTDLWDLVE